MLKNIQAPLYKAEFEAFSKAAKQETLDYCAREFEGKEKTELFKKCIETQYTMRMNYYMNQESSRRARPSSVIIHQNGTQTTGTLY